MATEERGVDGERRRENTIRLVSPDDATGRTAELYEEIQDRAEIDDDLNLSKLWQTFGNDPELMEILWRHTDYMYNRGSLPFELKSKISMVVASVTECEGCKYFHESALEHIGLDEETISGLRDLEIRDVGFSPEEEVILKFSEKAADDPYSVTDEDLEALRELGLSETEILEVFDCVAFHVYTSVLQGMAGIVYPGMSRDEWTDGVR
jgi:uncharacterized peroxidase-related enzyme